MATTPKGIYYPNDYNEIADIPEDMKKMAESIDEVFENTDSDLSDIKEEQTTQNNRLNSLEVDNTTNKSDILTNKQEINNIKTEQTIQNNRLNNLETDNTTNKDNISANTQEINNIKQEQTEQNTNISTNATNIETLQAENEKLKSIVAQMPQVTGQGTEITLENTIEATFAKFDEEGNSTQESTEGRNYLPQAEIKSVTSNGVTITSYADGKFTIKGTPTAEFFANFNFPTFDVPANAYFHLRNTGNASYNYALKILYGSTEKGAYAFPSNNKIWQMNNEAYSANLFQFFCNSNAVGTAIDITLQPSIELTDAVTDFEKYTNGASPSPNWEQPIYSAGDNGSINEKIQTKNLLEITEDNKLIHCSYVSGANTNEYKLLCTANDMYVNEIRNVGGKHNKTVNGNLIPCEFGETIYFDIGNSLFTGNYFSEYDENLISLGYYTSQKSSGTYTPKNSSCKYITFRFGYGRNSVAGTTYTLAPIVSKTPIDSYVPYKEQTYSIPVQQPMRSIGDVRDCFVKKSDGWYERHKINRKIFDGTEQWTLRNNGDGSTTMSFNLNVSNLGSINLRCNKFQLAQSSTNGKEGIAIASELISMFIQIKRERLSSVDVAGFKTWLAEQYANGTPVYIDYILAEPLDLLCTSEQINVLENLPSTYKDFTYVTSEDETEAYLEVSGIYDMNKLITRTEVLESES